MTEFLRFFYEAKDENIFLLESDKIGATVTILSNKKGSALAAALSAAARMALLTVDF